MLNLFYYDFGVRLTPDPNIYYRTVFFCGKIELMRNNLNTQDQYKISEGNNQLVLMPSSSTMQSFLASVRHSIAWPTASWS